VLAIRRSLNSRHEVFGTQQMPMVAEMWKATTQGIASNRVLRTGAFALAIVGVWASVCSFSAGGWRTGLVDSRLIMDG
jgi:hypothetical protein